MVFLQPSLAPLTHIAALHSQLVLTSPNPSKEQLSPAGMGCLLGPLSSPHPFSVTKRMGDK